MRTFTERLHLTAVLLAITAFAATSQANQTSQSYDQMHAKHHSGKNHHKHNQSGHGQSGHGQSGHGQSGHGQGGGMSQHQHDEVNMPGLNGIDTTEVEVDDLKRIFRNHTKIERRVENLANGIRTVTETGDETLRESIVNHVALMVTRLEEDRNPQVMIQSPTLDRLFAFYDEVETEIELTDRGVAVLQTSANPEVVALLQKHAGEVSDMAERGMQAVHERMMGAN